MIFGRLPRAMRFAELKCWIFRMVSFTSWTLLEETIWSVEWITLSPYPPRNMLDYRLTFWKHIFLKLAPSVLFDSNPLLGFSLPLKKVPPPPFLKKNIFLHSALKKSQISKAQYAGKIFFVFSLKLYLTICLRLKPYLMRIFNVLLKSWNRTKIRDIIEIGCLNFDFYTKIYTKSLLKEKRNHKFYAYFFQILAYICP